jgi:hypothetical protein
MTGEMRCDQVRDLAPELALGIAEGQERVAALSHLSGCPGCRQLVSDLSSVGDGLLLLAPSREPPRGFESSVLARLDHPLHERRVLPLMRRRRWVAIAAAAAVVLAAAVGGLSVFWATADDRRLADSYQAVLSQGQGAYFLAAPLQGSQGRVGTVFGYQGRPSWVMLTMEPSTRTDGRFQVQVVTRDGRYLPVGDAVIGGAERTWGAELPVDLSVVQELRFTGSDERIAFIAPFDTASPWD